MRRVNKAGLTVKLLLILFMLVSVIFPLCCMLFNLFEVDFGAIVSSPQFLSASLNSVSYTHLVHTMTRRFMRTIRLRSSIRRALANWLRWLLTLGSRPARISNSASAASTAAIRPPLSSVTMQASPMFPALRSVFRLPVWLLLRLQSKLNKQENTSLIIVLQAHDSTESCACCFTVNG